MPEKPEPIPCPLCIGAGAELFFKEPARPYLRCHECSLIFVPSRFHLSSEEEKKRYGLHENNPDDPRYREFLNKLAVPLAARLPKGAKGIDFGSGPGPALSIMLSELGFSMKNFDPFYANDPEVLEETYDFLACSEAMEHFSDPKKEWELFMRMVKKGGFIGVMTDLLKEGADFPSWHYKKEPTHVCFYSQKTFQWLAERHELKLDFFGISVAIFQR
ncbi:MAG: class I SAM-dependent methyltransferase [Nitrospinae bacterium]|nr:class I SAM-dependent methyltransferase [Nitrospinota bacterium]